MNAIIITGRLTRDPELTTTKNGLPACKFAIAVATWHKDDDTGNAIFVECSALGKTAEYLCKYCRKGDTVGVQGKIDCYSWKDNEGKKRKDFFIAVSSAETILHKNREGAETTEAPTSNAPTQARENREAKAKKEPSFDSEDIKDEDLPF